MFAFQDPAASTLTRADRLVDKFAAPIGCAVEFPFAYRRLTRVGAPQLPSKRMFGAVLGFIALTQHAQRVIAVKSADSLDADSLPAWHTPAMLPLMVTSCVHGRRGATLGRTATGPVVVFDTKLLKTGSVTEQVEAYLRAAKGERISRPEVAVAMTALSAGSWLLLRRAVLGAKGVPAPVSGRRAVTFLVLDAARSAAVVSVARLLKRPAH